jgi:hypothetical protein
MFVREKGDMGVDFGGLFIALVEGSKILRS